MNDLDEWKKRLNVREGYMGLNGIEVTALSPGYCQVRAPMGPDKANPHGMAHGGYLFTLCDTAAGIAASTLGRKVVGRTASIHFLRPGSGAYFTAEAHVIQSGRHMVLGRVDVLDERDSLVATADVEMFYLEGEPEGWTGRVTSSVPG